MDIQRHTPIPGSFARRLLTGIAQAALCGLVLAAPASGAPAETKLGKLLLSSPWCSFSDNKTTGYSNSKRYRFFKDGTYAQGAQSEGTSSGAGGSFASQRNTAIAGRWSVQKDTLLIGEGQGELQAVSVTIKRNANGAPILVAGGPEYSQCR